MKKSRLFTAVIAAFSALTAFSAAAYAADVIDFENGKYSFVSVKTDDGGDPSVLSVVDFNGSKQLKVDVQDCKNVSKVCFNINSILKKRDFEKVKTIEMDITIESKDGKTPPGWAGGAIGTQGGGGNSPAWSQTPWEFEENEKAGSEQTTICKKFLLYSDKLVNGRSDTEMILMRWGAEVDYNMYVDNVRFLDSDGNALTISLRAFSTKDNTETAETSAVTETEAVTEPGTESETVTETETEAVTEAVTETVTEPATEEVTEAETEPSLPEETEEETAPESDEDTTSSTTGNVSAFAAASAIALSGYGAAMTGKKKKQGRFRSIL